MKTKENNGSLFYGRSHQQQGQIQQEKSAWLATIRDLTWLVRWRGRWLGTQHLFCRFSIQSTELPILIVLSI